jgi:hypothetical protein
MKFLKGIFDKYKPIFFFDAHTALNLQYIHGPLSNGKLSIFAIDLHIETSGKVHRINSTNFFKKGKVSKV